MKRPLSFPIVLTFLSLVFAAGACGSSSTDAATAAAAPPTPSWRNLPASVDLYEGRITDVPLDADGVVEAVATGNLEVEVLPGLLRLRAGYGLEDVSLAVDVVAADGARSTFVVALRTHALAWRRTTWEAGAGAPQTREHAVFAFDPESKSAFMLQGSGYKPQWKPVDDSWRFDVETGTWSPWTPSGDVPKSGAARRLVQVPGSKIAYVLGGYTGWDEEHETDTNIYRFDLGTSQFTKLTNADPMKAARELHAMAYDPVSDQIIVYGGVTDVPQQKVLGDTWLVKVTGDTASWTAVKSSKLPVSRYGAFYALDAESRRLIVWGGAQFPTEEDPINAAHDAWALDLAATPPAWSQLSPAGTLPRGRRNGCIMHDPVGRRLFVFGGTSDGRNSEKGLFVLSLEPGREVWTKLSLANAPPPRSSGFGFSTPEGHVACGFGNDKDAYADVNVLGYFD